LTHGFVDTCADRPGACPQATLPRYLLRGGVQPGQSWDATLGIENWQSALSVRCACRPGATPDMEPGHSNSLLEQHFTFDLRVFPLVERRTWRSTCHSGLSRRSSSGYPLPWDRNSWWTSSFTSGFTLSVGSAARLFVQSLACAERGVCPQRLLAHCSQSVSSVEWAAI